mmetsp:Transcript_2477/g.7352  ORF Transcript_2477/g.7352 Transcript_2477/m.7352 type:complete len:322 (-) Transcript_2477:56-1021(-)
MSAHPELSVAELMEQARPGSARPASARKTRPKSASALGRSRRREGSPVRSIEVMNEIIFKEDRGSPLLRRRRGKGASEFAQMSELPVEPLVRAVNHTPWRHQFANPEEDSVESEDSSEATADDANYDALRPPVAPAEVDAHNVAYLRRLWVELRVPMRDRDAFAREYIRPPPLSKVASREVARQIQLLLVHRRATRAVLAAIERREEVIGVLETVVQSMRVMPSRFREGEKCKLAGWIGALQREGRRVYARIAEWRRTLWRPLPFLVQHGSGLVDYYQKMQVDGAFLKAPLKSLGLTGPLETALLLFPSTLTNPNPNADRP